MKSNFLRLAGLRTALVVVGWAFAAAGVFAQNENYHGIWYDGDNTGFYDFRGDTIGDVIFEYEDGRRFEGTYKDAGLDNEGARMIRAEIPWDAPGEVRHFFFRIYPDGKSGYAQYKCMKYPFFRQRRSS